MIRSLIYSLTLCLWVAGSALPGAEVLVPEDFARHIERFNANDPEDVVNQIPNAEAFAWMVRQAPLFECPSAAFEEIYYFRWWTYRKHIKQTPDGRVLTEFILPVTHAGPHNTVACALGHHIAEGRWLRDQALLDEYILFWYRSGPEGGPAKHYHQFSSWAPAAVYDRYLATGDERFLIDLLDDLVADYRQWVQERQLPGGMFWQHDVKDGMEESISGGRRVKNVRPTINSYMAANARAIAKIARLADLDELAAEFQDKHLRLREALRTRLWDSEAAFYKVRGEDDAFSTAREAIGFIPWMFRLATPQQGDAWLQLNDPQGFWAPSGLTTAERRHPEFRTHGVGTCEWDGAVWPFATSQTLAGLANAIRAEGATPLDKRDYFEHLLRYARSHRQDDKAYIGEYHDEVTGAWLITGPKAQRSRFYNHSTFNDLVITGLVGLVPRADDVIEVDPLIPEDAWDWFCLDGVPYHGQSLTIIWDKTGERYGRGPGLIVLADGVERARSDKLQRVISSP